MQLPDTDPIQLVSPQAQLVQGELVRRAIAQVIQNPLAGALALHYRAELADPSSFTRYGQPDYLGFDPGTYTTGVQYGQPIELRGIFCRAKLNPFLDKSGIRYQAEMNFYVPHDPGEVFVLDAKYPKRQDKFVISGGVYYATGPATPCQMGDTIAAWQIDLSRERYPVATDVKPQV